jgi:hypothetical protein
MVTRYFAFISHVELTTLLNLTVQQYQRIIGNGWRLLYFGITTALTLPYKNVHHIVWHWPLKQEHLIAHTRLNQNNIDKLNEWHKHTPYTRYSTVTLSSPGVPLPTIHLEHIDGKLPNFETNTIARTISCTITLYSTGLSVFVLTEGYLQMYVKHILYNMKCISQEVA